MIGRILEFSLRQRAFVLMLAAILVLAGGWAAFRLPIDAVPDITNVQVQINTEVPALAPEEIERLVTFPLEVELTGIPGMEESRSLSRFGLSQITLIFRDGTDIYRARLLVSERLPNALEKIPTGLTPKLAPITTGLSEIYQYVVDYAPDATNKHAARREQLMELKLIQDFTIKPLLRTVKGVAEINAMGGYEKQIVVMPRPEKLREANMTFDELAGIVAENVENAGGGVINRDDEQLIVRSVARVANAQEIAELPIKYAAGVRPLLVRDVADIGIGSKVRTGAATENGEEAVVGMVMMLTGENSRMVAKQVGERIQEIRPELPHGVVIRTVYDRSSLVDRTIRTVETNLFEGAVLVAVVLLLVLGNWRAALIVAAAIPLSFAFAMTAMVQSGLSGNLMSLGAIDFGLIIDGAVVIVENIVRQLAVKQRQLGRALTRQERLKTVLTASKEVSNPMFFGVVIITIVYVPIFSLSGVEGRMFHPMALAVMFCLGASLVLALTLMPVLCSFLLWGKVKEGDDAAMRLAKRLYRPVLEWSMRHRWIVTSGAVAILGLSLVVFSRLGAEFVPRLDEGSITAMIFRTNSINLDASLQMELKTERVLREHVPEIERVFSRIGTSEVATDPMPPGQTDLYLFFKPQSEWRKVDGKTMTREQLAREITELNEKEIEGQEIIMSQPIEMRFNELLEGVRSDLAVKIFGNDYDELEKIAAEIKGLLEKIPGAEEVEFEASGRVPMLEAHVNREALIKYNLHSMEINSAISTALGGRTVGTMVDGNRHFDIVVRLPEELREQMETVRELSVRAGETGLVPLSKVADFRMTASVDPIKRESGQRRAAVLVNLRGRDVEGFVREAERKIAAEIRIPDGYTIEFGGQFKNLQAARARLMLVVPAALGLILVLVFMALGSLRQTILIYTGVPLAATGGVFALWARGLPFSISAAVGFIALSGVAVLNGLVMISYFNQRREAGTNLVESVVEGALTRLRPVLMTALVASFGFIPMAISHSAGADVQRPLATVVIGGILTSTFLTLVLLPVLYAWFEKDADKSR